MKTKEKGNMATEEPVNWNVEMEVNLFHAMRKHKPVAFTVVVAGVNRHFQMLCIHDKLSSAVGRKISARQIWSHLASMYDLQALQESEILPFPNKSHEFALPESDFSEELRKARAEPLPPSVTATPPPSKEKEAKDSKQDKGDKTEKPDKTEKAEKVDKAEKAERVEPEPKGGKGKSGGRDKGTVQHSKTGGKSGSATKATPAPPIPATPASTPATDSARKRKRTRNTPNQDTPTKRRR